MELKDKQAEVLLQLMSGRRQCVNILIMRELVVMAEVESRYISVCTPGKLLLVVHMQGENMGIDSTLSPVFYFGCCITLCPAPVFYYIYITHKHHNSVIIRWGPWSLPAAKIVALSKEGCGLLQIPKINAAYEYTYPKSVICLLLFFHF